MTINTVHRNRNHIAHALLASLFLNSLAIAECILPTPAEQANFNPLIQQVVQPNPTGSPASYGLVTLNNIPPGYSVTNGNYIGWCMNPIINIDPGVVYNPIMYDTTNPAGLAGLASIGVPTAGNVWNKVNYIINNKPPGANASTIQAAIWRFINFDAGEEAKLVAGTYGFGFPAADLPTINAIEANANVNASFVPGPGALTAIYLDLPIPPQTIPRQPFIIEVICSSVPPPSGPPFTYTMGGWGSKPRGNNPGAFLAANFAAVYPSGQMTVGTGTGPKLTFTSASAISNFLPSGGTPGGLQMSHVNPTKKLGVLAGQVVALRLAVDFSNAGVTPAGLINATFKTDEFAGKTVGYVLALAESALSGALLPAGISYSDLSDACAQVNENYDAGLNNGHMIP
jgi:hypothetical protein